jgi:hypothetical protein
MYIYDATSPNVWKKLKKTINGILDDKIEIENSLS